MKKRGLIYILISVIILIIISLFYDNQISNFLVSSKSNALTYLFLIITLLSHSLILFLFLTSLFLWDKRRRKWVLPLWFGLAISAIIAYVLKIIVHRPRPFQAMEISLPGALSKGSGLLNGILTWNSPFSFPSMHALTVFVALPIISKEFRKLKYIWFVFACLVAFSRTYFGLHYLSDVLAGAVIGYLIGFVMVKIEEKYDLGLKLMRKLKVSK